VKTFYFVLIFLLISCGGGGSTVQTIPEVETITYKNVPEDITFLN
tara:strand:- start:1853 stop:1987 length:135 start_codon:yes stop_codon:yes gene_type:complete